MANETTGFDPNAYMAAKTQPAFDPNAYLSGKTKSLAEDKAFDPVEHYSQNPSPENLTTAREVFKQRAQQPTNWSDFITAIPKSVVGGVAGLAKGAVNVAGNLATEVNPFASESQQQRAQRENAAALQTGAYQGFDSILNGGWRNLQRLFGKTDRTLSDQEIDDQIQHEAAKRAVLNEMRGGKIVEGGAGEPLGFGRVERNTQTPEQLATSGTPVRPDVVESESFLGDPRTYALEPLAKVAGPAISKNLTAPILKAAGGTLEGAGNLANAVTGHNRGLIGAVGVGLHSASPIAGVTTYAAGLAARNLLPKAGQLLTEAGEEAAGAAPPVGQSLASKVIKSGAQGTVTGAALSAPYIATAQSPEEAGEAFGGGIGIGGVLGGAHGAINARNTEVSAKFNQLANEGSQINYGLGWDAEHQQAMANLSPEAQRVINAYRARYNGMADANGIPIQIYALGGPDYTRALQENHGGTATDTRGFISPDGTKIFLNADLGGDVAKTNQTLGHEAGGHLTEFLGEISKSADVASLQNSIRDALYQSGQPTTQFKAFMRNYAADLAKNGASADQIAKLDPKYFEKEFLAQHAAQILDGENIANFHLPKPITERLIQGISTWLQNQGISPKQGGEIGWGAKEIKNVTSQLRDILYKQGAESESLKGQEQSPAASYRIAQLKQIVSEPTKPNATVDEVNARDAAKKELDDLLKKTGQPVAQAQGPAPANPVADSRRVAAALRVQGIPKEEAAKWASVAEGNSIEEKVVDALRKRANAKFPNTPQTQQSTNVSPPAPNESVSPQPVPGEQTPVAVAQETQEAQPNPAQPQKSAPPEPVRTREEVQALIENARNAATAKEKKPSSDAAQKRIQKAVLDAVMADIGESQGLSAKTDKHGITTISGDLNPNDARHMALAEMAGLASDDIARLESLQQAKGTVQHIRYNSAVSNAEQAKALTGEATRENTETGMTKRKEEYAADPAAMREEGTVQHKAIIPLSTVVSSPSGGVHVTAMNLDNVLHNAASIFEGLKQIGRDNPYGDTPSEQQELLMRDAQAYADNHAHGFKGDGSGPMKRFPDSNLPSTDPNYTPQEIPKERFYILNMAFKEEKAGKLAGYNEELKAKLEAGKEPTKGQLKKQADAQELHALAVENNRWVDPASGETNQLRKELKDAGFDTEDKLKSPFETLSPQHILEIGDEPLAMQEGDIPTVRPHGFTVNAAELGRKGYPNTKAVGAGFMPDTGKPEEGGNPGERLAREAEEAGVMLSLSTLRGLIREDSDTMNKIRQRIQEKTGNPARFQPEPPYDPTKDKSLVVNEDDPPLVRRFLSLMKKEDDGTITDSELDILDKVHARLDKEHPGGSRAILKRFERNQH